MNLATILTDSAQRSPDHTAVALDDERLTYAQLDDLSARVAALLAGAASAPATASALMMPNVPQFLVVLLRHPARGGDRRPDEPAAQEP